MSKFSLPDYTSYPRELVERLRAQLRRFSSFVKWGQVLVGAVLPVAEGVFVNLATGAQGDTKWPYILCLVVIAVLHIFLLLMLLLIDTPLPQFLVEFDEQAGKVELTQAEVLTHKTDSATFLATINAALYSLIKIKEFSSAPEPTLESIFQQVLWPWVEGRTEIFWFREGDAFHNFAVYMLDGTGALVVTFRDSDGRIITSNRSWRPGDGHVGTCFLREETIFLDIPEGVIPDNLRTTQPRPEDYTYYRSMVATPIIVDDATRGVFVVTSSKPEQFAKDVHAPIMDVVSMLLAQAVKYSYREEEAGDGKKRLIMFPCQRQAKSCEIPSPIPLALGR